MNTVIALEWKTIAMFVVAGFMVGLILATIIDLYYWKKLKDDIEELKNEIDKFKKIVCQKFFL